MTDLIIACILGIIEGLTEFLPVSSTGHLILAAQFLGVHDEKGKVFEVVIQLAAILAVCFFYRRMLWQKIQALMRGKEEGVYFVLLLLLAFLPAAIFGLLLHDFIKSVLFSPWVVVTALILGGILILFTEQHIKKPAIVKFEQLKLRHALILGFGQTLALIPGTSRSAATIITGLYLGLSRPLAAEFSFLLAIPTMIAATGYDFYQNYTLLDGNWGFFIVGSLAAFFSALLCIRLFLAFISRYTFRVFGWYRIILGMVCAFMML